MGLILFLFAALLGIGLFFLLGSIILKVMYVICIGIPIAAVLLVMGLLLCVTVIGIPFGLMLLRAAWKVFLPF